MTDEEILLQIWRKREEMRATTDRPKIRKLEREIRKLIHQLPKLSQPSLFKE